MEAVRKRIEALIAYIDWKQNGYKDVMAGRIGYFSNLLPVDD